MSEERFYLAFYEWPSYYSPPDQEDEPECICADPGNPDADPSPDCYYHGERRSQRSYE